MQSISERTGHGLDQIAYIGDDVNDVEALTIVGFAACPEDACESVKAAVDYVCARRGGEGVFRELAELIIHAQLEVRRLPLVGGHVAGGNEDDDPYAIYADSRPCA